VLALGGCGGSGEAPGPPALKLSREDFLAVCGVLERSEAQTAIAVAATKRAWPLVADGLPRVIAPATRQAIAAAATGAEGVRVPALMQRARSASLTGPAAEIAGLFRNYVLLSTRGWRLTAAAASEIQSGSPGARFARENVALYIESVYDGHFSLAQIGKKLRAGYRSLGGEEALGASLSPSRLSALEQAYSEASDRLHPHVGVRLGS
jgi:hypothetical protein